MNSEYSEEIAEAQVQLAEFSKGVFTDLQHDLHELNHEIPKESPLEKFRHEYAKLFGILQKSMTNQARYIDKCRVLESEIVGSKSTVRTVTKLSDEDAHSISNLSDERNRKQQILQENIVTLQRAMEDNDSITTTITCLENELEQCVSDDKEQNELLKALKTRRTEMNEELDELSEHIPEMQESSRVLGAKLDSKDKEIEESLLELKQFNDTLESKHREGQQEQQRLFELERDREATRLRLKETNQRVKERSTDLTHQQELTRKMDKQVREQRRRLEGAKSEKQEIDERAAKGQRDLAAIGQTISMIDDAIAKAKREADDRVATLEKLHQEVEGIEMERERVRQRQKQIQTVYDALRMETDTVKGSVDKAEMDIENARRHGEALKKQIDSGAREQNVSAKRKDVQVRANVKADAEIKLFKNQSYNIDCEVTVLKNHIQEIQQKIFNIETEREHYSAELSASTAQYLHAKDVMKDIKAKVGTKVEEIQDADKKVRRQQKLYENVRGERENASKKVKEVQADIDQLKHAFERMKFAIEQHKDDVRRKEKERIKDRRDLDNVRMEESRLREKFTEVRTDMETAQRAIIAHEGELSKLDQTIKDAEAQLKMDEQKLDDVKKERDHMSDQKVARDKELKAMDDKLAVVRNQCQRGQRDYDAKEEEIARIREKLNRDQAELDRLAYIDVQMKERREQIHDMQKELLKLKSERAAMEEELRIPINIHRWTLLESSDPERFERLKRYQELQTELVARTKEVSDLQDLIKARESEYQELQAQVRRKPGIEVDQRVAEYSGKAKSEKFSYDQITAELEMYRDAVKEYRKEISEAQSELTTRRNKWLRQKKRDIRHRQTLQEQQDVLDNLGLNLTLT